MSNLIETKPFLYKYYNIKNIIFLPEEVFNNILFITKIKIKKFITFIIIS